MESDSELYASAHPSGISTSSETDDDIEVVVENSQEDEQIHDLPHLEPIEPINHSSDDIEIHEEIQIQEFHSTPRSIAEIEHNYETPRDQNYETMNDYYEFCCNVVNFADGQEHERM